jgi:glutathione synthase/RimK-type ligase-like ATP-grasp enzyme
MTDVSIIGNRASKSCRAIISNTGIRKYAGQKTDAIVNYGVSGERLDLFFRKYPLAIRVPMLNNRVGRSKYSSVKDVENKGIVVPETKLSLSETTKLSDWIEKRVHSSQGYGIIAARGRGRIAGKYYQKMIKDRKYELRVHAFSWIPKKDWAVHKRVGPPDQIAWNFHQGGHFQSMQSPNSHKIFTDAKDISEKILSIMGMSFGAVDLIVDNSMKIYFIEINSSPGFSELSKNIYFNDMAKLTSLSAAEVKKLAG